MNYYYLLLELCAARFLLGNHFLIIEMRLTILPLKNTLF